MNSTTYRKPINTYTFANGFRIIYEKSKNNYPLTNFDVFCDVGSVHEDENTRGASHFIEHMTFKGTKRMDNSIDIIRSYDDVGAYFNATTTQRYTKYIVKCEDDSFSRLVDILSDLLLNSIFNKKEYEKEKNVVIEENLSTDNEDIIWDMTSEINYKNTNYQYPVDHIKYHTKKSLDYNNIIDFYNKFYQPHNMLLSITTNISFANIIKILKKTFFYKNITKNREQSNYQKSVFYKQIYEKNKIEYDIKKSNNDDVTYLHLSFRICNHYSSDVYPLRFLSNIIGGYFSSRLFVLLRENNGLTYSSYSDINVNEISGDFTIGVKSNPSKIIKNKNKKGVLPIIIDMLNDLYKNGISNEELELTKNYIKGSMNSDLEKNSIYTNYNGKYMLLYDGFKDYISYEKIFETYYEGLTQKDINDIIKKYFIKKNLNVCVLGKPLPSENIIKKECEKLII
jgi:predicted Zn-dependent peptidase